MDLSQSQDIAKAVGDYADSRECEGSFDACKLLVRSVDRDCSLPRPKNRIASSALHLHAMLHDVVDHGASIDVLK